MAADDLTHKGKRTQFSYPYVSTFSLHYFKSLSILFTKLVTVNFNLLFINHNTELFACLTFDFVIVETTENLAFRTQ